MPENNTNSGISLTVMADVLSGADALTGADLLFRANITSGVL